MDNKEDAEKDINIEQLYNEQLGFEDDIEGLNDDVDEAEASNDEQPFNADSIRIEQQTLSLKYVYELYQDGLLIPNPGYQRQYVWEDRKRRSRLIESLMLRIPIPAFYFYEQKDSSFLVIDGQQRLKTAFDFIEGNFKLSGLEYLSDKYDGRTFNDLDPKYQQRIRRTQLNINILDERSPQKVIYDIFRRINSGGMPLNPQEMRNALCTENVREFLKRGANSSAFTNATRNKIKDLRLDKQETFLRFATIYRRYDYEKMCLQKLSPTKLINLMDQEIQELDKLLDKERDDILTAFEASMERCHKLFDKYAFVNISINSKSEISYKTDIINKPLLTAFSVLLANPAFSKVDFSIYREQALVILATQLKEENSYQNSISKATGDERNIKICFECSLEVLKKCGIINQQ
jgi:hypothetical protein